jgi:beta-mannanase
MNYLFLILPALLTTMFSVYATNLGVYDPNGTFNKVTDQAIENVFISWSQYRSSTVTSAMQAAQSRNRWLLLTLEPWSDPKITANPNNLLSDVVAGKYDKTIQAVCTDIKKANHQLFVRWGQEMEQNFGRYRWSTTVPANYIAAYRHVVNKMKLLLPANTAYYVWSPTGNADAPQYYPGPDVIHYIGLSVYSFAAWDTYYYGAPQSFKTIMDAKYHVAYICNPSTPVMVCEMGAYSSSDSSYQNNWIAGALSVAPDYSNLRSLVWFVCKDPASWGAFGNPDFTIKPSQW